MYITVIVSLFKISGQILFDSKQNSLIFSSVRVSTSSYPRRTLLGGVNKCSGSSFGMSILRPKSNLPPFILTTLRIVRSTFSSNVVKISWEGNTMLSCSSMRYLEKCFTILTWIFSIWNFAWRAFMQLWP